jgi:UDP-N-acetylmuramate dehydrogenase
MAVVDNLHELEQALAAARAEGLQVVPMGRGSNVVLAGDIDALVLRQRARDVQLIDEDEHSVLVRVYAGQDWHALVEGSLARGWYGLENLALIPGEVGAAPIQNIGAYGVELAEFTETVHALSTATGEVVELGREECRFGYRDSVFKHELRDQLVITAVDLRLHRRPASRTDYPSLTTYLEAQGILAPSPRQVFDAVVAIRSARLPDPSRLPNAGSFFKNPVVPMERAKLLAQRFPELPNFPQGEASSKLSAAWMIDDCGSKGRRIGDAGIHANHALVLVNHGAATGSEVMELAVEVRRSVADRFGVTLEIEPRIYGEAA